VHLGELALVSLYHNDRLIREVRYQHERSDKIGYRLRIWTLERPDLEAALGVDQGDRSGEHPRPHSPELCIDFVNTLLSGIEKLGTYQDLLLWGTDEGIVTPEITDLLRLAASFRATDAEKVMVDCRRFREAVRGILKPEPDADDLEYMSAVLRRYLPHLSLRWIDGKARWVWPDRVELERVLWPVAQSVLTLVTSDRRKRVRACVSCNELFIDRSRNNSRRWCDMRDCGNRAKARRFHVRIRATHR
jgi:predicted RNA-binding Zn ribbon-like protein